MRRGFTVLELLVASLLLAMLVTMLSMMFNQSSIAWRTGVAGVAELNDVRANLGAYHDIEDDILPGIKDTNPRLGDTDDRKLSHRTVSLWDRNDRTKLYGAGKRSFSQIDSRDWEGMPPITIADAMRATTKGAGSVGSGVSMSAFAVGVQSAGPNRRWGDADDITNWPEDVE